MSGGNKNPDRKGGDTMEHIDRTNEVKDMTNGETLGLLEAIKIITERADSKEEVIEAIERIQGKIKEPTSCTK